VNRIRRLAFGEMGSADRDGTTFLPYSGTQTQLGS
jgi:hypothetical protein